MIVKMDMTCIVVLLCNKSIPQPCIRTHNHASAYNGHAYAIMYVSSSIIHTPLNLNNPRAFPGPFQMEGGSEFFISDPHLLPLMGIQPKIIFGTEVH